MTGSVSSFFHHDAPAADVSHPRRVNGLLQVEAAIGQIDQHLCVALRLDVPAHHAVRQQQPSVLEHHRGDQGVKGTLAGLIFVGMRGIDREPRPPVVQHDAGFAGHDPRSEGLKMLLMNETAMRSLSTTVK